MMMGPRIGWLLGLCLLSACKTAPPPPPPARAPFAVEDYRERAPSEIAVLPPTIAPNFGTEEGDLLREHVYTRLIEKGYTVLDPAFVDQAVSSQVARGRRSSEAAPPSVASMRASLDTDAYLFLDVVNVKVLPGVDPSVYRIEVRATLLDGGITGGTLFEHRIPVTYEVDYGENRELSRAQLDDILRRYAAQLINSLPGRMGPGVKVSG
ncbi:MAG: hypothetical protein V2A76_16300 [Planctomycetota bacterium]